MDSESAEPHTGTPSRKRSFLLFGLLGVMLAALAYDYKVARPDVEAAYETLVQRNAEVNADPNDMMTPELVSEVLEKAPSDSFNDGTDFVEVFSWRGGLVFRSHKLYVAYRKTPIGTIMSRTSKFAYDGHDDIYEVVGTQPTQGVQIDTGEIVDFGDLDPSPAEGPAPGHPETADAVISDDPAEEN